ncbi:hypothetical protein AYL99_05274 [Fonsecaea erecta]|uniref:Uncharacterized protein n=1 Tax=Fonsecaea erecta TaxID=1367422 RepID=A0A178ZKS7_9EURO|nr:hypothetical protein AYL99_05274 [Fonsecaea erecta]OAP60272.1 hypothetical protein AYL99_05274 [Fonsecaea erecta]
MSASEENLAPEIQYMVVGVLVAEFERLSNPIWSREHKADIYCVLSTLLSVRLTCRGFSQAGIIKAAVFKEVTLQATRLSFNCLRPSSLLSIAPFVRKTSFLPTPFSTSLDLKGFTRALEILSQHESDLPVRGRKHVEGHWGAIPTTESEVAAAFGNHRGKARVDEYIMNSGELHPLDPSEDSGAGDGQMFTTAIQCLESSCMDINAIFIHRTLAQHFSITPPPSWNLLDLSRLETLKFPDLVIEEHDNEYDLMERDAAAEFCLTSLLQKPLPNLRELSVDRYVPFPRLTLPSLSPITLPRLRTLTLGGILLGIEHLTDIVTSCTALREVSLRDCHPQGPDGLRLEDPTNEEWQPLFNALSHHPTLRRFTIAERWDARNNEGEIVSPYMLNNVGVETYRVMLQTGMSAGWDEDAGGIWDAALQVYLAQQQ